MSSDLLIHIGEGESRKTYRYEPKKMLNVEYIAIEQATGLTLDQLGEGLTNKSMTVITALVWALRKRNEPGLQFFEVLFELGDVLLEDPDKDEVPAAPKAKRAPARKP